MKRETGSLKRIVVAEDPYYKTNVGASYRDDMVTIEELRKSRRCRHCCYIS